jgi:hypothetical protein
MDVHKSITMIVVLDVIGQAESLKSIYRGRGIDCSGYALYRADQHSNWLAKLNEVAARYRFRTKRQFWPHCGYAAVTRSSKVSTCELNRNHNPQLKQVFKGGATFPARRFPDESGDESPLFVSHFFSSRHKFSLARLFMRWLLVGTIVTKWNSTEILFVCFALYTRMECPRLRWKAQDPV